jgi:hypothetical protein
MLRFKRPSPWLSLALLLCALHIFLFPAAIGPYSAVNGPVTALRALAASITILWLLSLAALLGRAARHSHLYRLRSLPPVRMFLLENDQRDMVLRC